MKLTTPCDNGACLVMTQRPGGRLVLSTTQGTGEVVVTVAEVVAFAEAVQAGHFDALLGRTVVGEG